MDLGLRGTTAIVTGGSEGIGYATARALAREGARVVIAARREDALQQAAERIRADLAGGTGEVVPFPTDVSRVEGIERLITTALERFGRLDILVNNAGTSRAGKFESVSDEVWQEDLDLKFFAAIRACRLAIPAMRRSGGGSIVNVLNIGAKQPAAASVPTSVSRAAGMALTKALSKEFAPENVRVNAVLIGLVKSGQHERSWRNRGGEASGSLEDFYADMATQRGVPLGRVAEAEEAGDLIAFLCSARATYLTGTAINFDGGTSAVV
ncbi:MAG TPA: SDR family oxidoreductase [Chloroflexota bacterium]|nr:SDR family oxidoreductase [Chloroflexota bacterium]